MTSQLINNKIRQLQYQLRQWHLQTQKHIEKELSSCKEAILTMDRVKEGRPLSGTEFSQRQMWREKAYYLSSIIEIRWQQRARCRWLAEGDNNTRFFHSFPSTRLRANTVHSLLFEDEIITDANRIRLLFHNHMQALLGTQRQVGNFNPSLLFENEPDLHALQEPFSDREIESTIFSMANNRASGPDGLPSEFAKINWTEIKGELIRLVQEFYHETVDLRPLNTANIIMIPKKNDAVQLKDYRPISIISLVPKIISKLLAVRLSRFLPSLISINQTAFVRGRQISENFVVVREIMQYVSQARQFVAFFKIDFAKAFDTVNWDFLLTVMRARGFPLKWINWIEMLLNTASSRVVINGEASEYFPHKRGLRQGDPLSPMLFLIAVDVMQRMLNRVTDTLDTHISAKLPSPILAFQYADDTSVIAHADLPTMITLKLGEGKGIPLINWEIVCTPNQFGGLGVPDLELRNCTLLMRWWWKATSQPGGDGKLISYWYDNWGEEGSLRGIRDRQPRPSSQLISLNEAISARSDLLQQVAGTVPVPVPVLTDRVDAMSWRWSGTGHYSALSLYNLIITTGKTKWKFMELWVSPAPSKVKFFCYLVLQDRVLTHEILQRRGMTCDLKCVMCDTCPLETAHHLFFQCPNAIEVWGRFLHLFQLADTVEDTWEASLRHHCYTTGQRKSEWATSFMAILWSLWRQRNELIFRGAKLPTWLVANRAREDAGLWTRYCGNSSMDGFEEFESRRRKKFDKQIDSNIMMSSNALDEACCAFQTEAVALLEAIKYVKGSGLSECTFYSDNKALVELVTSLQPPTEADWRAYKECYESWKLIKQNSSLKCSHILRSQNDVADCLAKKGREHGWKYMGYTFPMF
ncbi:uncharacterized protein LOC144568677 [Carex rostrata]